MTYRWNDGSDMFYWVYLDPQGVVQRAHPGMEFVNAPERRLRPDARHLCRHARNSRAWRWSACTQPASTCRWS